MKWLDTCSVLFLCWIASATPVYCQTDYECTNYEALPRVVGSIESTNSIWEYDASENRLVYIDGDGFHWYDVSSSDTPVSLGAYACGPANHYHCLTIQGELVYYLHYHSYNPPLWSFEVLDFSSPASPVLLSSTEFSASSSGFAIRDNVACIAIHNQGVHVYDISDPSEPAILSQFLTDENITAITTDGQICWVTYVYTLAAYDITDAANPAFISDDWYYLQYGRFTRISMNNGIGMLRLDGTDEDYSGHLYSYRYLKGVDATDLANIDILPGYLSYDSAAVDNGLIFIRGSGLLQSMRRRADGAHESIQEVNISGQGDVVSCGSRLWCATEEGIVALRGEWGSSSPVMSTNVSVALIAKVVLQDDYIFFDTHSSGWDWDPIPWQNLYIYNITDPEQPVREHRITGYWPDYGSIVVRGDYVYYKYYEDMILGVCHWPTETYVAGTYLDASLEYRFVSEYIAYGYGSGENGIAIYDFSDPVVPVIVGAAMSGYRILEECLESNYLFCHVYDIVDAVRKSVVVDVEDPYIPKVVAQIEEGYYCTHLYVDGENERLYMLGASGCRIYSIENANSPILVGAIAGGPYTGCCSSGHLVYLAKSDGGYSVVDVSDMQRPVIRGCCGTSGVIRDIRICNGYLILAENDPDEGTLSLGRLACDDPLGTEDHSEDPLPALTPLKLLAQPYPNPFNPRTTIDFSLARSEHTSISIFDLAGRLVVVLADQVFGAGEHSLVWHGRDRSGREMPSGSYFVRMETESTTSTRKVALVR